MERAPHADGCHTRHAQVPIISNAVRVVYMPAPRGHVKTSRCWRWCASCRLAEREGSIVGGHGNLPVLSRGRHIGRASEVATRWQRCESADGFRSVVCPSALAGDQVRGHHRRGRTSSAAMRRPAHELPDTTNAATQVV